MNIYKYPAIIIGSGISGLYCALRISQSLNDNQKIAIITKSTVDNCNSYYAQGGMVTVLNNNKSDSVELHIKDTINAGAGLTEFNSVKFISENSDKIMHDLLNFGVEFDRDESGNFTLTKEAAHSVRRILHCKGDATGREMELALIDAVKKCSNIEIIENSMVVKLLKTDENKCCGGIVLNSKTEEYDVIYSPNTILATGGTGQIYKYTTNPIVATGDGIALAYDIGAKLQDIEFVQFHPTAFAIDDKVNHNRFLISEAVRGEGTKLCDKSGRYFMENYHSLKDLAPRDIVARGIFEQMEKTGQDNVFLDATIIGKEKLLKRFPTIAKKCASFGIDITKDYIPVAPAAHYFMGGIKTNVKGETNIDGLFAIGEVSSTGLHGANRLASNSLLECVVCAYEVAKNINLSKEISDIDNNASSIINSIASKPYQNTENIQANIEKLKELMWENFGIFRTEKSLDKALEKITTMKNNFSLENCASIQDYEYLNMLTVAKLIVSAAIKRKESRGAHFRLDYLSTSEKAVHSVIDNREGELDFVK